MSAFRTHGRGHLNGPVVVIGTGLLGTSIGLGLRGRGVAVTCPIRRPPTRPSPWTSAPGCRWQRLGGEQPELVVVASPPDVTAEVVERALADYPDAIVLDIASVKGAIVAELRRRGRGPRPLRGHPPDGRAREVRAGGRPRPAVHLHAVGAVPGGGNLSRPRCRRPRRWPATWAPSCPGSAAEEHDEAVALVSHLPQVMPPCWPAGCRTRRCVAGPGRQRAARHHPHRRQRPHAVGADPGRERAARSWRSSTASGKTWTG